MNEAIEAIKKRRSVRKSEAKLVSEEIIQDVSCSTGYAFWEPQLPKRVKMWDLRLLETVKGGREWILAKQKGVKQDEHFGKNIPANEW